MSYQLAILGNDEPAIETALLAARQGLRVAAVLPRQRHSAWFLAQALRRLTLELSVALSRPQRNRLKLHASPSLLRRLLSRAIATERADQMAELRSAGVDVILGEASFFSRGWIRVSPGNGQPDSLLPSEASVIAVGVRRTLLAPSLRHRGVAGPEQFFQAPKLPATVRIVGGDEFGIALGALASVCGIPTEFLHCRSESSAILELALESGARLVNAPDPRLNPDHIHSAASAATGCDTNPAETLILDCRRAVGFTGHLRLDTLGIQPDENGLLWCSSSLETWCPGVFGAGDAVGFSPAAFQNPTQQSHRIVDAILHPAPSRHTAVHSAEQPPRGRHQRSSSASLSIK